MRPSTVKRLQILGVYRDVDLGTPAYEEKDAVQREKADQQGVSAEARNPEDRDREIYECYCELDLPGFEHKWKGKASGLEIPYRVTIDVSSKEILSIVRNYDEDDAELVILPRPGRLVVARGAVMHRGCRYDLAHVRDMRRTTVLDLASVGERDCGPD